MTHRIPLQQLQPEACALAAAHSHNSKLADQEPAWGDVDKTALPRLAYADMGEEEKKSTWKYPHHHIVGGNDQNDDGLYTDGTLYLHKGGLAAAWAAANGARSGEKAAQSVIDHLEAHRKAIYPEAKPEQETQSADATTPDLASSPSPLAPSPPPLAPREGMTVLSGQLKPQNGKRQRREYPCTFIKAGRAKAKGGRFSNLVINTEPLREAVAAGLFNSRASFINHPSFFENQDLNDLIGLSVSSQWNEQEQSVDGVIRFYDTPLANEFGHLLDQLIEDSKAGQPVPDVGLSIIFYPRFEYSENGEDLDRIVTGINHVETIDWVFGPAAEGRMKEMLMKLSQASVNDPPPAPEPVSDPVPEPVIPAAGAAAAPLSQEPAAPVQPAPPPEPETPPLDAVAPWLNALKLSTTNAILASSNLPQASRERLARMPYADPQELLQAIEEERRYLAAIIEPNVINIGGTPPREPAISGGRSSLDKIELAFSALLDGLRPSEGIQPLSGVREFYHLMSGDYEMTGVFQPDRLMLANVNASTMAGLVANALNKRVINSYQIYPKWWAPMVSIDDFSTLQEVKWITLGGIGELPTVAEGAAYTEMTWDDQTETASFTKKGGYLGITLEAIDKDDTGKLRAAPKALAQAAWLTLSKAISAIFTANSGAGPTLSSDAKALFHIDHGNLGATALSFSAWEATRKLMRQQTELSSGERLGALTAPRYLLVPSDLEISALQILMSAYEPGQANWDENPLSEGNTRNERLAYARERIIVVDLWTDTNNWAAVADPHLYPTIGLGFRYGRTPEVFSVASPTAGLMFTNDVMPIKVRFFFATGPMDYRGMYKHNVA